MKRIALNGFGRIGKNFLRAYLQDPLAHTKYTIVAINIGPADIQAVPYMIQFDSLLPAYTKPVLLDGSTLLIENFKIKLVQETDAARLPWAELHIDFVVDATGHYTHAQKAQQHIKSGAKKVVITAPAQGEDCTVVMGVNQSTYDPEKHSIISLASCTTNALAPLIHVMKMHASITHIMANTVHSYTNTQALLDVDPHVTDLRKSRAAGLNIIPATTGAAVSVAAVFPDYAKKISACALRVPVPIVSLAEVTFLMQEPVTVEQVHTWFDDACQTVLKNILAVSREQLVSGDFQGNGHSVIFDQTLTLVAGPLVRLSGWYDNEWAYSNRIKDFLVYAS